MTVGGSALPAHLFPQRTADRSESVAVYAADPARGGYILAEAEAASPAVILIAAGDELPVALEARRILQREGLPTRVVSMASPERFRTQDQAYRDLVLPPRVGPRVSVEAGSALGWSVLLGQAGQAAGIDSFGVGAPSRALYESHGLAAVKVAAAARAAAARPFGGRP